MNEDDRHALERYVAGAPVAADAFARAITGRAVDRALINEALLRGLESDEAVVRRRTAERVARMPDLDARVAARLRAVALTDADAAVASAAGAALRTHGVPLPGDPLPAEAPAARGTALLAGLRLIAQLAAPTRGEERPASVELSPRKPEEAPHVVGTLHDAGAAGARLELRGLPDVFVGTRPSLHVRLGPDAGMIPVGRAAEPVAADGTVTVAIPAETGTFDELLSWIAEAAELKDPAAPN